MIKRIVILLFLSVSLQAQTPYLMRQPIVTTTQGMLSVTAIVPQFGVPIHIGLQYRPVANVWTHYLFSDKALFTNATVNNLSDTYASSMDIKSLDVDSVKSYSLPSLLLTGNWISASIAPYYPGHKIYLGKSYRPIEAIYTRSLETDKILLQNIELTSTTATSAVNYDNYPIYPNSSYFNWVKNDSIDFTRGFDIANSRNYLEGIAESNGSALQYADLVVQKIVPNDYDEFATNFIQLQYSTQQQDTTITYLNIKVYEDTTLLYQTHKFCSLYACIWYDTTIVKTAGSISALEAGDNMILRIEFGVREYVNIDHWIRTSRLRINFK